MGAEKRTQNWILVAVVLIVAIAVPIWKARSGVPPVKQGIDLVGGVDLLLEAILPEGEEDPHDMMLGAIEIVRNRLDPEGVKEIIIQQMGDNRIVVQIPGEEDPERVKALVGTTATLRFIDHQGTDPIPEGTRLRYIDPVTGEPATGFGQDLELETGDGPTTITPDKIALKGYGLQGFGYPPDESAESEEAEEEAAEEATEEVVEETPESEDEFPLSIAAPEISMLLDTAQSIQLAVVTTQNTGDHLALVIDNKVRSVFEITDAITYNRLEFPGLADDPDFNITEINSWLEGLKAQVEAWEEFNQEEADALQNRIYVVNTGREAPLVGDEVEFVQEGEERVQWMDITTDQVLWTGEDFKNAEVGFDPLTSAPKIDFEFKPEAREAFGRYTARNVGKFLAIALDDRIISCPVIRSPILGGRGEISGNFTQEQVVDLVIKLDSGRLPVPLEIIENRTVGPTLGEKSIADSRRAAILGAVLILLYMAFYYRLPGLLADIALIFYAVVFFGVLALLDATLTLPGIAGFILSVGMAVDANVIIFERLKEELRTGKTFRSAVDAAFKRAFLAIFDANVTTLITGLVLYNLGTGPIKGFAVTLCLGILVSMFSALVFTRLLLETLLQAREMQKYSFFGLKEKEISTGPKGGEV